MTTFSKKNLNLSPLTRSTWIFALGIFLGLKFPGLSKNDILFALVGIALPIIFIRSKHFLTISLISFLLAGILFGVVAARPLASSLRPLAPKAKYIYLKGRIGSLVSKKIRGKRINQSFTLSAESFRVYRKTINVSNEQIQIFGINLNRHLEPGDCVELKGSLSNPPTPVLPGQFDFGAHLNRNQINYTMMLIGPRNIYHSDCHQKETFSMKINRLRQRAIKRYSEIFPPTSAAIASALVIGYQKEIPKDIREKFVKTGTAHLLAVSGLNITLVVSFFYAAMIRLGFVSATRWNPIFAIFFAFFYCLIAGANPPVARASLMIFIASFGTLIGRSSQLINLLFVSLLIVLVLNPMSLLSPSLQLSYLAVFALIVHMPIASEHIFHFLKLDAEHFSPAGTKIRLVTAFAVQNLTSTLVSFVWLWPVVAHYFNTISFSSFIANLTAAPFYLIANILSIILLGISIFSMPAAQYFAPLTTFCFTATDRILATIIQIPFGHYYVISPDKVVFSLYYIGLVNSLITRHRFMKIVGYISIFTALCLYINSIFIVQHPEITIFSNGGKAQFLIRPDQRSVVGLFAPDRSISFQNIDWSLTPFLRNQGISTLNQVLFYAGQKSKNLQWLTALKQNFRIKNEELITLPDAGDAYLFEFKELSINYSIRTSQITAQTKDGSEFSHSPTIFSLSNYSLIKFFRKRGGWLIEACSSGCGSRTIYKLPAT